MAYAFEIAQAEQALIIETIRDYREMAEGSYTIAMRALQSLAEEQKKLNIANVDVDIGATVQSSWPHTPSLPYIPTETVFDEYLPADIPAFNEVTKPSSVSVGTKPSGDPYSAAGKPSASLTVTPPTVPQLGTLPTLTAVVPVIDVGLLSAPFSFTEPTYTERVSPEVESGIKRVLGGAMGLPQEYWSALWNEVAGDLARQQAGKLRAARNRGAASFWPLPGETILAGSRVIADEGARAISQARLEQAKQQAVFAREDFWQAVSKGIEYEAQWIGVNQQVAARALAAAEQLVNLKVAVQNTNIARYNAEVEAAKATSAVQIAALDGALRTQGYLLQAASFEIESAKLEINAYQAKWSAFQTDASLQISGYGEAVKFWMGQGDMDAKYESLKQQKGTLDVQAYSAMLGRIDALAGGTAKLLGARVGLAQLQATGTVELAQLDARINMLELEKAKLTQAAQEMQAKIEVAQAEWLLGQGIEISKDVAQLTGSITQAAMAAGHVALGASVSYGTDDNYSNTYPHDKEKVW